MFKRSFFITAWDLACEYDLIVKCQKNIRKEEFNFCASVCSTLLVIERSKSPIKVVNNSDLF